MKLGGLLLLERFRGSLLSFLQGNLSKRNRLATAAFRFRTAIRAREIRRLLHRLLELAAHLQGPPEDALGAGHLQERLVEAEGFDVRREVAEHAHHDLGDLDVAGKTRRYHNPFGAEPHGFGHRHRASDTRRSGLVARGGDDAAPTGVTDDDRLSAKLRPIHLFD